MGRKNILTCFKHVQKQPPRGFLRKRCSENMQQIYRRTPMPKCDFSKKDVLVDLIKICKFGSYAKQSCLGGTAPQNLFILEKSITPTSIHKTFKTNSSFHMK